MIYNAVDGTVFTVQKLFLDDSSDPLLPKKGFPQVRLLDSDGSLLSSVIASPSVDPGLWTANVTIPDLGLSDKTELRINWRFLTVHDEKYRETDGVVVEPKSSSRVSDIVTTFGDSKFTFVLPIAYSIIKDSGFYQLYDGNTPLMNSSMSLNDSSLSVNSSLDKTVFRAPMVVPSASLSARLLKVDVELNGAYPVVYTYKLWAITPQILNAMSYMEDFLNKSRIENTISELRWNDSDLLSYLERGLWMFNTIHVPTSFNGLNMQGPLLDSWLLCSCYYALGAQLLAEGSLAFDFSGQGVSLNVDRTPQLDSALGRIESTINDRVMALKKHLMTQGILSGDGAVGKTAMLNPYSKGTLAMINAPTTRIRGISSMFTGRRS